MRRVCVVVTGLLVIAVTCTLPARAQWLANGNPVSLGTGLQNNTATLNDGSGGAFVVWQDWSTGSANLLLQRITAVGTVASGWPAAALVLSTAASDQMSPVLALDGSGGVLIAWEDYRAGGGDANVYAQRITGTGTVSSGWPVGGLALCTAAGAQGAPTLAAAGAVSIVVWQDDRNGSNSDIYAQRVSATGVVQWAANGIALCTATGTQMFPSCVNDGAGGVFVAWQDRRGGASDIYVQRMTSAGAMSWGANGALLCGAADDQLVPRVIGDGFGGMIASWDDYRSFNADIYAQRLNAAGTAQWAAGGKALCTDNGEQYSAPPVSDGGGGVIVPWSDWRGSSGDLYAQRVTGAGSIAVGWPNNGLAVCALSGDQSDPVAVSDGLGGMIVAWSDARPGAATSDIYAQRVTAAGAVAAGWIADGVIVCDAVNGQYRPSVGSSGTGDALVAWHDERSGPADIYLRRLTASGSVDVAPTVVTDFEFAPPAPNPAREGTHLHLRLAVPSRTRLEIIDLGGRAVRRLLDADPLAAGSHTLYWDGRDASGRKVAAGLYFVRLEGQAHSEVHKLTVLH